MQVRQLGSYELIRKLGQGGMATVYLARDVRLGREVAVKVLDMRLAQRTGFRERFLREARVAAALDHPNIVPLYDFGESEQALFLVMPYISGGSLQDILRRAPLPMSEVVSLGTQMADALDYAHQRNVVHRDVKPANMLRHADGRLMLSDFGLAKVLIAPNQPAAATGRPDAGTPEYMAPEQIQGRTEARSDIYGLGVVLYLLLTGVLPFTGATSTVVMEGHLYRLPEHPRRLTPTISPAMEAVILRALAKHPEDRYQRAKDLGAALLEALIAGPAEPLPFTYGAPSERALPPLGAPAAQQSHGPASANAWDNWEAPRVIQTGRPASAQSGVFEAEYGMGVSGFGRGTTIGAQASQGTASGFALPDLDAAPVVSDSAPLARSQGSRASQASNVVSLSSHITGVNPIVSNAAHAQFEPSRQGPASGAFFGEPGARSMPLARVSGAPASRVAVVTQRPQTLSYLPDLPAQSASAAGQAATYTAQPPLSPTPFPARASALQDARPARSSTLWMWVLLGALVLALVLAVILWPHQHTTGAAQPTAMSDVLASLVAFLPLG